MFRQRTLRTPPRRFKFRIPTCRLSPPGSRAAGCTHVKLGSTVSQPRNQRPLRGGAANCPGDEFFGRGGFISGISGWWQGREGEVCRPSTVIAASLVAQTEFIPRPVTRRSDLAAMRMRRRVSRPCFKAPRTPSEFTIASSSPQLLERKHESTVGRLGSTTLRCEVQPCLANRDTALCGRNVQGLFFSRRVLCR